MEEKNHVVELKDDSIAKKQSTKENRQRQETAIELQHQHKLAEEKKQIEDIAMQEERLRQEKERTEIDRLTKRREKDPNKEEKKKCRRRNAHPCLSWDDY